MTLPLNVEYCIANESVVNLKIPYGSKKSSIDGCIYKVSGPFFIEKDNELIGKTDFFGTLFEYKNYYRYVTRLSGEESSSEASCEKIIKFIWSACYRFFNSAKEKNS